jgi:dolichol-phosphate mannosyltransferase
MPSLLEFSIVIPVYNEKLNIQPSIEQVVRHFGDLMRRTEILFVDDDSPDGTAEEILRMAQVFPNVVTRLVQHGRKEGIGAAHLAGYRAAKGRFIMCLDADLSQSASDLLRMKHSIDQGVDLVIGSRYMPQGEQRGKSWVRNVGSQGMNFLVRWLLNLPLKDTTHTFRMFRKEVFDKVEPHLTEKGHPNFQVQLSFWSHYYGFKIKEIPIIFTERKPEQGISKVSVQNEVLPFLKLLVSLRRIHKARPCIKL